MKRNVTTLLMLSLTLAAAVIAAPDSGPAQPQEPPPAPFANQPPDSVRIRGAWTIVQIGSKKQLPEELSDARVIITAKSMSLPRLDGSVVRVSYTLDPTQSPKAMDTTELDVERPVTRFGIYELDGDTLKLCSSIGPKVRPERFDVTDGSLLVLKRSPRD